MTNYMYQQLASIPLYGLRGGLLGLTKFMGHMGHAPKFLNFMLHIESNVLIFLNGFATSEYKYC